MPVQMDAETDVSLANSTRVEIGSDSDLVVARQLGRTLGAELGFSSGDLTLIAAAISELARNIVHYANWGEIILQPARTNGTRGLAIVARDEGPGIPNIHLALQDGFSTSGGLGLGLPGVKRLMDEFEITSKVGRGTVVSVKKWNKQHKQ